MLRRASLLLAGVAVAAVLAGGLAQSSSAYTFFQSPSKNIGCLISKKGVRCDIIRKSWRPPPKPSDCPTDWGYGLAVDRQGKGHFFCAGDSAARMGKVIRYGKSIRRGRFKCTSKFSGMRCQNLRTKHGFKLSRERARRF